MEKIGVIDLGSNSARLVIVKLFDEHFMVEDEMKESVRLGQDMDRDGFLKPTCGIKVSVLSEEEEATYVYRGVINSMDIPKGIILEIGGGSTKIVYYNRRTILNFVTLGFGAVTLTDLFKNDGSTREQTDRIEEFFTEQFRKIEWLNDIDRCQKISAFEPAQLSVCNRRF